MTTEKVNRRGQFWDRLRLSFVDGHCPHPEPPVQAFGFTAYPDCGRFYLLAYKSCNPFHIQTQPVWLQNETSRLVHKLVQLFMEVSDARNDFYCE